MSEIKHCDSEESYDNVANVNNTAARSMENKNKYVKDNEYDVDDTMLMKTLKIIKWKTSTQHGTY